MQRNARGRADVRHTPSATHEKTGRVRTERSSQSTIDADECNTADDSDVRRSGYCAAKMSTYETIATVAPTGKHTSTIIFFHGAGESGTIWTDILSTLRKPNTKIICPSAPKIPLTLNKGFAMPAWFDVSTLNEDAPENEPDILRAVDKVHALLDEELARTRLPPKKLMLGGFSQGGALALYAALTYHRPLAAVLMLSSWIPLHKSFPDAATNNTKIPILQCHGTEDPVIPYAWGMRTSEILKEFTTKSQFNSYEGLLHRTNEKELADIKEFIQKLLT